MKHKNPNPAPSERGSDRANKAKKSLGQHFLKDQKVIEQIVTAIPQETNFLLEIGPGPGAITYKIYDRAKVFCVLEKDDDFADNLKRELLNLGKKNFIFHEDALIFSFGQLWDLCHVPADTELVVAGNLPYNVATEIVLRLLKQSHRISRMILMFQKEVGERLAAHPNSKAYSSLSLLAQNFFTIKKLCLVKPGAFQPPPKVDSIVLQFDRLPSPILDLKNSERYDLFEKIIRAAFAYRRKTLSNSLSIARPEFKWQSILSHANIDGKRRAENLDIHDFGKILEAVENFRLL